MPRDRDSARRHNGKSGSSKSDSPAYSGRASWPIVEWYTKHELSKLGLPGSIVHHEIEPPASPPSAPATTPSSAAPSAASSTPTSTSTSTSTPSTGANAAARAAQETKSAGGTVPADFSVVQAQLQNFKLSSWRFRLHCKLTARRTR